MRGNEQSGDGTIRYPRRNIIAVTLLVFVTCLSFIALFNLVSLNSASQTSSFVTVTGVPVCLPHKDAGDVVTLECAIGLKGDDGRHYALTGSASDIANIDFNRRIKVRGVLNEPASDTVYDVSGSLEVKSYTNQ